MSKSKGVGGSAAEKHANQLEKWASEYYDQHELRPKGILVVNAFRTRGLTRRPEAFPSQMLPYAEARGHLLVTTLQVLGVRLAVDAGDVDADSVMQSLFETVGPWPRFRDHAKFLSTA